MQFKIDDKIFEQYPSLNIGVVVAKGINNTGENTDVLAMLVEQSNSIKSKYDLETLKEVPKIHAWREAYSAFGAKPKKYTCSVENLYRMILEDIHLKHINKIVDIYNYISLKHMVPVGGDDIDKVDGDITLRFATGKEPFIRLNSDEIDYPKTGEVIYADNKEVLCRRWNWRECDKSKMTEQTKNVTLVVEGLAPVTKEDVQSIVTELEQLVRNFCGGKILTHVLNRAQKEIEI
ncbi:MAG: lysyl-tRNA synthetase, lysyl-tRNA synthetase, class II [Candidatus Peregrinibacteria bacterium GW2011_GWE2_39_6]|nr:MAG: lysyl-tRNA synthetase, lysyl-tRNA synthetase, class II [Candidatus Peregrinibacteria bacterium GW2011_GWF2_39_17]KKR26072.1 MAG: lysyl-tRNA synthetase, lysyl-tRNA synthetase, class II [Candidatus Peregrinibacteria bacterium GW2011_GWE2_39_6]